MSRARLDALTGLRAVAAGMIVVHHSAMLGIPVPPYAWDHGVSFFFVLSGFIISFAYPKLESKNEVLYFLGARIARIWPAHLAGLLVYLACFPRVPERAFVANVLLVQGWVPSWPWYFSYNAPSWSISSEWFFYLAFPVLIFHWRNSWWWKWIASAALVALLIWLGDVLQLPSVSRKDELTLHGLLYVNPLARLFEFTTGMVVYSVFRWLEPASRKVPDAAFTILEILVMPLAAFFVVSLASWSMLAPLVGTAGRIWAQPCSDVVIFPFVVLVFAFGRGWLSRVLASPPMVLLGELSFSVYLVHSSIFSFRATRWPPTAPDYIGLVVCIVIILVLALLIWCYIEIPCRRMAKQWLGKALHRHGPAVPSEQRGTPTRA